MDIIQAAAIHHVPVVHRQQHHMAPVAVMAVAAVMVRVRIMVHAVRRLHHVHVQSRPRPVIHCVPMFQIPAVQHHVPPRPVSPMVRVQAVVPKLVMGIIPVRVVRRQVHLVRVVIHTAAHVM